MRDRETVPEGMLHRAQVPPRPPSLESLESEQIERSFDDTPEPDAAVGEPASASTPDEPALDNTPPAKLEHALDAAPSAVLEPTRVADPSAKLEPALEAAASPDLEHAPEPAAAADESDSRPTHPEPAIVNAFSAQLPPEEAQTEPPAVDDAVSELAASRPDHRHDTHTALDPHARAAPLDPKKPLAGILPPPAPAVSEIDDFEPAPASRDRLPGERSLSPISNDTDLDEDDEGAVQEVSPETLAVRARMRRIVGAGLGLLAAGIAAGAIIMAASKNRTIADKPAARTTPTAADERSLPAPAPPEVASDKAPDVAGSAKADSDTPSTPPSGEPANVEKARALNVQALALLKRHKSSEAVPVARAAIEADPDDALSYLYLGSALQDMGRWKDAMSTYDACVKRATRGMVDECRAMGGQKK